jgi:hypothetical protein
MDSIQFAAQVRRAIDLNTDDIEVLEQFATSLPKGWQHEIPTEELRWFCVHAVGIAASLMPTVLVFNTNAGHYSVAILDESYDLRTFDHEVFDFESIAEVISLVRSLICEFMQTENPSWLTPLSWTRCLNCDASTHADCSWINPMKEDRGCSRGHGASSAIAE